MERSVSSASVVGAKATVVTVENIIRGPDLKWRYVEAKTRQKKLGKKQKIWLRELEIYLNCCHINKLVKILTRIMMMMMVIIIEAKFIV
jgi:hypothetical protein